MVDNPHRDTQGGDVGGMKPIDVTQGEAVKVAKASFDPGYPLGKSLQDQSQADLVQGYCKYGKSVGG